MIPKLSRRASAGLTRRSFIGRAAVVGLGVSAGLGRIRVAGAASQVNLSVSPVPCNAPSWAAVSQGFFKDEGLDVTVVDPNKIGGFMPALANATIDAGMTAVWSIVPPRLVAGRALGDFVLTAPLQRGCLALSVPADSPVQSVEDLRGANIAGIAFLYGAAFAAAGVDPNTEIIWSAAPANPDVFATLQTGEFAAVQSQDGQGALLEAVGAARMIATNNMPPAESNYCCGCMMLADTMHRDRSRAAAITRALMRGSAWAEEHRSEAAALMRPSMTVPHQREITQEDMEAALDMMAFVPMAEAARPLLVNQFDEYLTYGLPVDGPADAATLVDRIFVPLTEEVVV